MKYCNTCKSNKPYEEFYKRSASHDGLMAKCIDCSKQYLRLHYSKNKDKYIENAREWGKGNPDQYRAIKLNSQKKPEARAKRASNELRRRTRKIGNGFEPYNRMDVFERDNWLCGICMDSIDKSLDWPDALSASIDHVIPISKGGADTFQNVRASHLGCNIFRGNRIAGGE